MSIVYAIPVFLSCFFSVFWCLKSSSNSIRSDYFKTSSNLCIALELWCTFNPFSNTVYCIFFQCKTIRDWNALSGNIRNSTSLGNFKLGFVVVHLNCLLFIILGLENYQCIIQSYVTAVAILTTIFIADILSTLNNACVVKSRLSLFLFCTAQFTVLLVFYPVFKPTLSTNCIIFYLEMNTSVMRSTKQILRVQRYIKVTKRFEKWLRASDCPFMLLLFVTTTRPFGAFTEWLYSINNTK